jgi:hypothetical protein
MYLHCHFALLYINARAQRRHFRRRGRRGVALPPLTAQTRSLLGHRLAIIIVVVVVSLPVAHSGTFLPTATDVMSLFD